MPYAASGRSAACSRALLSLCCNAVYRSFSCRSVHSTAHQLCSTRAAGLRPAANNPSPIYQIVSLIRNVIKRIPTVHNPSISLSLNPSITPSLHPSISQSLHLPLSQSLHLSVSPSPHHSISQSLYLSIPPSLYLHLSISNLCSNKIFCTLKIQHLKSFITFVSNLKHVLLCNHMKLITKFRDTTSSM